MQDHNEKTTAELEQVRAVVSAMGIEKACSPEMLGQGKPNGGFKEHRQNRYDVLERFRRSGKLTQLQDGQWDYFKTQWDDIMAETHGKDWGNTFSEMMQHVKEKLLGGTGNAFSVFVETETARVLGARGALAAPGCRFV